MPWNSLAPGPPKELNALVNLLELLPCYNNHCILIGIKPIDARQSATTLAKLQIDILLHTFCDNNQFQPYTPINQAIGFIFSYITRLWVVVE